MPMPAVRDDDRASAVARGHIQSHAPALGRVFDGVVEDDQDQALHQSRVTEDLRLLERPDDQRYAFPLGHARADATT